MDISKLVMGFLVALGSISSCVHSAGASGDYESVAAGISGSCHGGLDRRTPVKIGSTCTVSVNYYYSGYSTGLNLIANNNRPISYWLEMRTGPTTQWRRFTKQHVIDANGITEYLKFKVSNTAEFRVAFDTYGQSAFAEQYSDSFKLFTK